MPLPKWFVVARNDYRVRLSSLRSLRPYFLPLVAVFLAVWIVYLAPAIVNVMVDDILAAFLSAAAVPLTQILLFMFFFMMLTFPISLALQEAQTGQLETFLSAPVRPGDVLLGEFMGLLPLYGIFIAAVTGFFTAMLHPLGLGLAQVALVIGVFVLTMVSALWIGTVVGALVRTKLGRTAHGKDVGRALALLIVLPPIAVLYAIMAGGLPEALANPGTSQTVRTILIALPSSWGAHVFANFVAHPGSLAGIALDTLLWFGGLALFFLATLWLGGRVANRAYSLELMSFTAPVSRREGAFFGVIRRVGRGRSFAPLLVSIFKEYGRRVENLSWVAYAVGLYIMVNVLLFQPEDAGDSLFPAIFLLPLLASAVAGDVTLRGKETLLICRKAPNGEGRYLRAVLVKSWIVAVPLGALIIAISTALTPQSGAGTVLWNTGYVAQLTFALTMFATGLFLLFPVPGETPREKRLTMVTVFTLIMMVSMGLFIASVEVLGGGPSAFLFMHAPGIWLLGATFLALGWRKLRTVE